MSRIVTQRLNVFQVIINIEAPPWRQPRLYPAQEFTDEDEEILVLFASQAATAIANARIHRKEQQMRANLETLIETSPVGVVVFDVRTLRPMSFNQEARRIVEGLRIPGRPVEQLQEIITVTRADGREIALNEFVLARELNTGEMVRAE